jgi:hypothetical protein
MTRFLSLHLQAIKEAARGCVAAANDWQWLVELRNEVIAMPGFPDWKRRYEHWHNRVMADAKLVSPNLCAWLDTLDQVRPPPARLPQAVCDEHRLLRDCQCEILRRMQEFLQAEMLRRDIEEIQAGAVV